MITKIGIIAGEIWQLLEKRDSMSLKDLVSSLDRPEALMLMSIGWLSREGHIILEEVENGYKISLRKKDLEEQVRI